MRAAPTELRFVAVGQEDPLAEPLLAELAVEYACRYGATEEAVAKWLRGYPADEFAPPGGGLLVGLLNGRPVTGGAFRRFDDSTAELKRIWTDSRYRRQGHAKALLVELEAGDRRPRIPERLSDDRRSPARGRGALPLDGIHPAGRTATRRGRGLSARFLEDARMTEHLHLAVALDGYGWHPEAWRHTPDVEPVTSGRYWSGLATTAERGLLDFVTFDDALTAQRRRRAEIEPRWLAGRPDAVLVASRVAPVTNHIGLIPVATVTHTEPFHVSKAIATLDFISHGPGRLAGPGQRHRSTRPSCSAGANPAARRPVRRGLRCRRGGAPTLGQLGGRRRHPRRRHRTVRRPRQTALHRLHRQVLLGQGPLDHAASAAGPARRGGTRSRLADLRVRLAQCGSGVHHTAGRRLAKGHPRRDRTRRRCRPQGIRRRLRLLRRNHRPAIGRRGIRRHSNRTR